MKAYKTYTNNFEFDPHAQCVIAHALYVAISKEIHSYVRKNDPYDMEVPQIINKICIKNSDIANQLKIYEALTGPIEWFKYKGMHNWNAFSKKWHDVT